MFFDFYDVNMSTKSKTDSEFSRVSFGDYNEIPYFCEIFQSKSNIFRRRTNYSTLPIQNVRQYHFHDVAKYEKFHRMKVSILRSLGHNEESVYLPVIRWHVAMVTAVIQKLQPKHKPYFNSTYTGKSLQGEL